MSRRLCCLALIALVVSSCAIQVAPARERDTKPPVLLRADPPDHTAGFSGNSIRLVR